MDLPKGRGELELLLSFLCSVPPPDPLLSKVGGGEDTKQGKEVRRTAALSAHLTVCERLFLVGEEAVDVPGPAGSEEDVSSFELLGTFDAQAHLRAYESV